MGKKRILGYELTSFLSYFFPFFSFFLLSFLPFMGRLTVNGAGEGGWLSRDLATEKNHSDYLPQEFW